MNIEQWMEKWREAFGYLGVELMVADVAQVSVVIDVAEKTVILAPTLRVTTAERILRKVYGWWRYQSGIGAAQPCSFMSC